MWGQAFIKMKLPLICRIIPTRVGTSEGREPKPSSKEDHPHACGDKSIDTPATFVVRGSSPRVWGQDPIIRRTMALTLIIPTRVGTRRALVSGKSGYSNHPHACGDKTLSSKSLKDCWGSSPRVWGQVIAKFFSKGRTRIIPTRVGTSFGNVIIFVWKRDHPHACGDKYTFKSKELERTGSSPRVWGQAACDLLHYAYAGIIPTRVGTSAVCRSYFTS